jgi:hypothetical protein
MKEKVWEALVYRVGATEVSALASDDHIYIYIYNYFSGTEVCKSIKCGKLFRIHVLPPLLCFQLQPLDLCEGSVGVYS